MTIVVLLVLAVIWAAVLLPPVVEKRRSFQPSASVGDFRHQLSVLQRTGDPYAAHAPRTAAGSHRGAPVRSPQPARPVMAPNDVVRRRRDVFLTLVAAAGLSFVLALAFGGASWILHLTIDAALLGYTAMLMQIQQARPARVHAGQGRPVPHQARPAPYPVVAAPRANAAFQRTHAAFRAAQASPFAANVVPMRRESPTQQALIRRQAN